jgi:hypothetical protein
MQMRHDFQSTREQTGDDCPKGVEHRDNVLSTKKKYQS